VFLRSLKAASALADLGRMEPPAPRMVREEGLSGAAFLSVVSLAVNAVLALAVFSMVSSEEAAEKIAKRLHMASAAEVAEVRADAAAATARADLAVRYGELQTAQIEEQVGLLSEQAGNATVEAAELRNRLDGLTDVAAIDDLVSQVNALHTRLTALEERLAR
jgi:hypothetical protein